MAHEISFEEWLERGTGKEVFIHIMFEITEVCRFNFRIQQCEMMNLKIESIKFFLDFKEKETEVMVTPLKPPPYLLNEWDGKMKFRTNEERLLEAFVWRFKQKLQILPYEERNLLRNDMFNICPNIISNNFTTFDIEIKLPTEMYTTFAPFINLMRIGNLPFSKFTIAVDLDKGEMSAFTHMMIGGWEEPYAFRVEEIQRSFEYWSFYTESFLETILESKLDHMELCDDCKIVNMN